MKEKMGKKKAFWRILFLMALSLCTACGSGGKTTDGSGGKSNVAYTTSGTSLEGKISMKEKDSELVYIAENLEWELGSETTYVDFGVSGDDIYYADGQDIVTYSLTDKSKSRKTLTWDGALGEWYLNRVTYGEAGNVYGVALVREKPYLIHYLCKFDGNGELVYAMPLTEYFKEVGENWSSSCRFEMGNDGCLYLSCRSAVWIFEEDGSYKGKLSMGNVQSAAIKDMEKATDGKLYLFYQNSATQSYYVSEIDTTSGTLVGAQKSISFTGIATHGQEMLLYDGTTVYDYDRAALALTPMFDWTSCNVDGGYVYEVERLSDGKIFAASYKQGGTIEVYLIQGVTKEEAAVLQPEKVEIKLAVLNEPSQNLKTAVVFFNRENEKYTVTIENYQTEASVEGDNAGRNRLNSEIAAGKGPDIVHMSFGNMKSLVEKGYYENLYDYLEKSQVLSKEDFLRVSLEEYNVDGFLVAIPHDISLQLYLGRKSIVGENPGWTLEEMLDIVEANEDSVIFTEDTKKRFVLIEMIRMNENYFWDRTSGECNFDNDLFKRILQFAAKFPDETAGWYEGKPSQYYNIESGNGFIAEISLSTFRTLQVYAAAYDGDMTCIGYPVEEGIGSFANSYDGLGISAQSECKEGAWAFIEYYLQYVNIDTAASANVKFPSYKPVLAEVAEKAMSDSRASKMKTSDGWSYVYHASTQEEVEQVYELLEASQIADIDTDVIDIIEEEAASYFSGDKSIDEVVRIIENRVKLYLEENR